MNFLKDPCCRPFFLRNEDLLPSWMQVSLWKPTDTMDMTGSDIFPWDISVEEMWQQVPKFGVGFVANGLCPTCRGKKMLIPMGYQGEPTDCPTCTKPN